MSIKVGFFPHNNSLFVLRHRGILERALPDIEWVDFEEYSKTQPKKSGLELPTAHSDGLFDGSFDFIGTGATPPVTAQAQGRDVVYLAISGPRTDNGALVVKADSPISTVSDLRGKKVGLAHGSWQTTLVLIALEQAGLSWSDIVPIPTGVGDGVQKFLDGELDAWVGAYPGLSTVHRATNVRVLVPTADLFSHRSVWWTRRDIAESRREEIIAIISALQESDAEIIRDPRSAAELFAGHDGGSVDDWQHALGTRPFGLNPISEDFIAEQQKAADLFYAAGLVQEKITVADAVIDDLVRGTTPESSVR